MNGCCLDRKYGKGCTPETCMALPEGKGCYACAHFARCAAIVGVKPHNRTCDFFPRRFTQRDPVTLAELDEARAESTRTLEDYRKSRDGALLSGDQLWTVGARATRRQLEADALVLLWISQGCAEVARG